jgi:hypothetical protein
MLYKMISETEKKMLSSLEKIRKLLTRQARSSRWGMRQVPGRAGETQIFSL